ncbi:MAG: N-acetyltransferase [Hyphomicrobiales bacterium]|nr:N-acetyltransferase [Hyphomicrobiales bacterium]
MITIRSVTPADYSVIEAVITAAFNQRDEADLVERLRRDGDVLFEQVATLEDAVVGHILFSRLPIIRDDESVIAAASLAPLCVRPDCQNRGTGAALVGAGLDECRKRHVPAIIVVGEPDYYRRFGFAAAAAKPLAAPFAGPHFMAMELQSGVLKDGGEVRYPAAFGLPV